MFVVVAHFHRDTITKAVKTFIRTSACCVCWIDTYQFQSIVSNFVLLSCRFMPYRLCFVALPIQLNNPVFLYSQINPMPLCVLTGKGSLLK